MRVLSSASSLITASRRNGGSVVTLDTGVAWIVTNDVQLDLSVARGVTSESPDWQWGVGLSLEALARRGVRPVAAFQLTFGALAFAKAVAVVWSARSPANSS